MMKITNTNTTNQLIKLLINKHKTLVPITNYTKIHIISFNTQEE